MADIFPSVPSAIIVAFTNVDILVVAELIFIAETAASTEAKLSYASVVAPSFYFDFGAAFGTNVGLLSLS